VFRRARCKRRCGRERRRTDRQLCGTSLEQRPQSTEQRGEIKPAQRRTTQISRQRPPRAEEQSLDGRPAQPELVTDLCVREAPPLAQHDRLSLTLRQLGERLAQPEQVGIVGLIGGRRLGEYVRITRELDLATTPRRIEAREAHISRDLEQPRRFRDRHDPAAESAECVQERRLSRVLGFVTLSELAEAKAENAWRVAFVQVPQRVALRDEFAGLDAPRTT
jgi:hypothetical protein